MPATLQILSLKIFETRDLSSSSAHVAAKLLPTSIPLVIFIFAAFDVIHAGRFIALDPCPQPIPYINWSSSGLVLSYSKQTSVSSNCFVFVTSKAISGSPWTDIPVADLSFLIAELDVIQYGRY